MSFINTYKDYSKHLVDALKDNSVPVKMEWESSDPIMKNQQVSNAMDMVNQYSEFGDITKMNIILYSYFDYLYKTYSIPKNELNVVIIAIQYIIQQCSLQNVRSENISESIVKAMFEFGLSENDINKISKLADNILNNISINTINNDLNNIEKTPRDNVIMFPIKKR